ncbi:hypothetical protein EEW87_012840 [Janibacter melonis]|uniref:Uncharacterized protein n=1 Tax=Janibacter melonis TaxID=262209 RepID=A0A5P8FPF6_9MICO|nr:hypothetical protein [Janibacter melonis]QFQ31003.2 hypothetical protein EEW87_012840 [Janibacter melonis]
MTVFLFIVNDWNRVNAESDQPGVDLSDETPEYAHKLVLTDTGDTQLWIKRRRNTPTRPILTQTDNLLLFVRKRVKDEISVWLLGHPEPQAARKFGHWKCLLPEEENSLLIDEKISVDCD